MTAFADRSLRDLVPVLDRYRPAALAATAILVAVAVLPGAGQGSGLATPAAFDAGFDEDLEDVASGEAADPGTPPSVDSPTPVTAPFSAPVSSGSFAPSPSSTRTPGPSPAPQSPAPTLDVTPGTGSGDDADGEVEALRIVAVAYASTTGGTPLPPEVPEGSLPVGARVDQVDKASYVRLAGAGSTLVLTELADGRRGSDFEASPVQACQITDPAWQPAENMSFADAPPHDPESCVLATLQPDGRWSIPLTAFADPADDRGIALVPAPDAPIDFQVTFAATVAT